MAPTATNALPNLESQQESITGNVTHLAVLTRKQIPLPNAARLVPSGGLGNLHVNVGVSPVIQLKHSILS